MVAENAQLKETIWSVLQYSQRECGKSRESLRTELETRITSVEEVRVCTTHLLGRVVLRGTWLQ